MLQSTSLNSLHSSISGSELKLSSTARTGTLTPYESTLSDLHQAGDLYVTNVDALLRMCMLPAATVPGTLQTSHFRSKLSGLNDVSRIAIARHLEVMRYGEAAFNTDGTFNTAKFEADVLDCFDTAETVEVRKTLATTQPAPDRQLRLQSGADGVGSVTFSEGNVSYTITTLRPLADLPQEAVSMAATELLFALGDGHLLPRAMAKKHFEILVEAAAILPNEDRLDLLHALVSHVKILGWDLPEEWTAQYLRTLLDAATKIPNSHNLVDEIYERVVRRFDSGKRTKYFPEVGERMPRLNHVPRSERLPGLRYPPGAFICVTGFFGDISSSDRQ